MNDYKNSGSIYTYIHTYTYAVRMKAENSIW